MPEVTLIEFFKNPSATEAVGSNGVVVGNTVYAKLTITSSVPTELERLGLMLDW